MSSLKRRKSTKHHLGSIQRNILEELSAGDMLYGFLLSAMWTRRMYRLARERYMHRQHCKRALEQLINHGYVVASGDLVTITEKGTRAIDTQIAKTRNKLHKTKWDKKWRIVAFDIPQQHHHLRARIRGMLKRAGFVLLQQSVWVFPHECEELVQLIQKESHLTPHILYGVLERVEGEARLKKLFKL